MELQKLKWAVYFRVTDLKKDIDKELLLKQKTETSKFLSEMGIKGSIMCFQDIGSAKNAMHQENLILYANLKEKGVSFFDVIILYSIDRMFRSLIFFETLCSLFNKTNTSLVIVQDKTIYHFGKIHFKDESMPGFTRKNVHDLYEIVFKHEAMIKDPESKYSFIAEKSQCFGKHLLGSPFGIEKYDENEKPIENPFQKNTIWLIAWLLDQQPALDDVLLYLGDQLGFNYDFLLNMPTSHWNFNTITLLLIKLQYKDEGENDFTPEKVRVLYHFHLYNTDMDVNINP